MASNPEKFGEISAGQRVDRVLLRGGGPTANILTWGATLQDLRLDGCDHPLVLGAPDFEPYLGAPQYIGAIVGRVANRIAYGRFLLDEKDYNLNRNQDGRHTLHSGAVGTANSLWTLKWASFSPHSGVSVDTPTPCPAQSDIDPQCCAVIICPENSG
ncbi:MAG: aldose epimerase family protein [Paracoccaceae bacterium]